MIKLYKDDKSCLSDSTTYMAMCLSGWSEHKEDIAKLEKERLEKERLEKERLEKERLEKERLAETKRLKDEAKKLAKNN